MAGKAKQELGPIRSGALVGVVLASYVAPVKPAMVGWVVLAFTAARFAAMGFNRIADRVIDARNPRTAMRELPSGKLGVDMERIRIVQGDSDVAQGIGSMGSVVDETEENWARVMHVNVDTMFLACKHAIPAMAANGGGAIVTISSISALRPRGLTAYSVSKAAVIGLTQAMAVDHGPQGIRANCVCPGVVATGLGANTVALHGHSSTDSSASSTWRASASASE